MSLSASRWICLLTLAVVMLFSASAVDTFLSLPCCKEARLHMKGTINWCFEQIPRSDCRIHAYLIINTRNEVFCIKATTRRRKWLQKNRFYCPSVISKRRYEVLDEDDVEQQKR